MVQARSALNNKQQRTLEAIFTDPVKCDIPWDDVTALVRALGGEEIRRKKKTGGSRVRFNLHGVKGFFHKPHPGNVADKGCVKDIREFVLAAGVVASLADEA